MLIALDMTVGGFSITGNDWAFITKSGIARLGGPEPSISVSEIEQNTHDESTMDPMEIMIAREERAQGRMKF